MKKFVTLLVALTFIKVSKAQNVNIPDANFKAFLIPKLFINTNNDSEIQITEAAAYTGTFDVQNLNISDLTGIEAFVNITGLNCKNNQLTELNLSLNTELTFLNCSYNQLTALDVSNKAELLNLECNYNQLVTLNVNNTPLNYLQCVENELTNLNVSTTVMLTYLQCNNNQLTSLDVSNNSLIHTLMCHYNQLTSLDVSNNSTLYYLYANHNQLSNLDVSNNTILTYLSCYNNQLTSLNVQNGNNSNMGFYAHANPNLSCIEVDDVAYSNQYWDIYKDANAVFSLDCSSYCTVNIPDANFRTELLNNTGINLNADSFIQCSEASSYTGIIDVINENILDLTGIEAFTNVKELYCGANQLTSLDLTDNTELKIVNCDFNDLTSLNVSNLSKLEKLECIQNQLTTLNVSNSALKYLNCDNNQLSNLDVSTTVLLTYLQCTLNQLTSLDVSNNSELNLLYCANNQLTSLDVSNNVLLESLYCHFNQISSLDVSNNSNLRFFHCNNNNLSYLNIRNNCTQAFRLNFTALNNPNLTCILADACYVSNQFCSCKDATATFSLNCLNEDASLSNLTSSQGTLSPTFVSSITNYTVTLPFGTTGIATLTPTLSTTLSTVTSNTSATNVAGTSPANQAVVVVTAESGAIATYTVTYSVLPDLTSINDKVISNTLIFPNPSNGLISVTSENNAIHKIEIVNTLGEIVYSNAAIESAQTIDLSNQAKGIYLVRVSSQNADKIQKIVIQ